MCKRTSHNGCFCQHRESRENNVSTTSNAANHGGFVRQFLRNLDTFFLKSNYGDFNILELFLVFLINTFRFIKSNSPKYFVKLFNTVNKEASSSSHLKVFSAPLFYVFFILQIVPNRAKHHICWKYS